MTSFPAQTRHVFAAAGALVGWCAVALQLYLIIVNRQASVAETVIRFFSFFTILTNILVALSFTMLSTARDNDNRFLTRVPVVSAIAVYIVVVGLVYNIVLRFLWSPQGLQRIVDEILHSVVPLLFLVYWMLFVEKSALKWAHAFTWLLYPLLYLCFVLARGATSNFYPYPFIDVPALGYPVVFRNCVFLFVLFLILSLLLIGVARIKKRQVAPL